jgi:hypothetical protein
MRTIALFLLLAACVLTGLPVLSQTMTSTSNTITLDHTCINQAFIGGSYTLTLGYNDLDNGYVTLAPASCTIVSNGTDHLVVTAPTLTFPTPATNGYWSLVDADNGMVSLTGGWSPAILYWYHDPSGTLRFNCVALPIYFSTFHATTTASTNVLTWTTQTEQNTTFIEVYRSPTGAGTNSYYKIGQVTASGNTVGAHNYTFTDANPLNGNNLYMLKMLNSQGTQASYSTISLTSCSTCHGTVPAAVNCPYSISGPTAVCDLQTKTLYTLSSPVPNFSTIAWSVNQPSLVHVSLNPSFERTQVTLMRKNASGTVTLTASISGCTNTISKVINIALSGDCGGAFAAAKKNVLVRLSPNPSTGVVDISIAPQLNTESTTNSSAAPAAAKPMIYQVKVADASGTVRKVFSYAGGVEHVTVNLSGLNGGIYTVQVFDNKSWTSTQMVLAK